MLPTARLTRQKHARICNANVIDIDIFRTPSTVAMATYEQIVTSMTRTLKELSDYCA